MENTNLNNPNSGILTSVWGPHMWQALHAITFGYPVTPTNEQKENYKTFFKSVANVLPCKYCRDSYAKFIITEPTILDDKVLENRETITKWLYELHNRVNCKLGMSYEVKFEDIVERFESFRAKCIPNSDGCNMPLNLKAESYKHAFRKDCPIIDYDLAIAFKEYAEKRGINDFTYLQECYKSRKNKKCEKWEKRNMECMEIIKNMRINAIPSLEKEGEFKDLPTKEELKLIARLCSNINSDNLEKVANKLGYKFIKIYKFKDHIIS